MTMMYHWYDEYLKINLSYKIMHLVVASMSGCCNHAHFSELSYW